MCRPFLVTIGCLMILFGITSLWMMPKLIQQKIEQKLELKIGTKNFERFTKIPLPLTVKFYLFNITNSDKVLQGLERPRFEEVGPFMYKQWRRRDVVDIIDNNRKLTYREFKTFYPIPVPTPTQTTNTNSMQQQKTTSSLHNTTDDGNKSNNNNNNQQVTSNSATDGKQLDPNLVNITIVNVPLLSILTQLAKYEASSFPRQLLARAVSQLIRRSQEKILVTKPANQLLFDGYKVGLMEQAHDLISDTFGFNYEPPLPNNKFGFFHGKNGTWSRKEAGEMTISTGRNYSMDDFMLVDNWNGLKQLNVWPTNTEAGNRCNEIRGSDGSQFHPGVTRDQLLNIFSPMICTSIYLKYKEDTSTLGIPLLRFSTPPDVFGAPKKVARNACYCTIPQTSAPTSGLNGAHQYPDHSSPEQLLHKRKIGGGYGAPVGGQQSVAGSGGEAKSPPELSSSSAAYSQGRPKITNSRCYIDGLIDLSLCQRGAPVAASSPHFYNADPMLALASGLKPNPLLHETHLDIEPMTGTVFRASSRAQINAFVEAAALDVVDSQLIGHMTPMVAPLFWLEESGGIDVKSSHEFKDQLLNRVQNSTRAFYISIVAGLLLIVLVAAQYWYVTWYKFDADKAKGKFVRQQLGAAGSAESRARRQRRRRRCRGELSAPTPADGRSRRLAATAREQLVPLGADARRSNVAAMTKTSSRDHDYSDCDFSYEEAEEDLTPDTLDETSSAAAAAASKLQSPLRLSVSRKPGADFRHVQRDRRNRQPDYATDDEASAPSGVIKNIGVGGGGGTGRRQNEDEDDQLSRKNLVDNEWPTGEITQSQTSQTDSQISRPESAKQQQPSSTASKDNKS